MNKKRVIVVQSRKDPVGERLIQHLRSSMALSLVGGEAWTDLRVSADLSASRPIESDIVALVCPASRNEQLSRELLARHPQLLIVRIDTASELARHFQPVTVDLVEHLSLDQREFGFDRLLHAMQYLAENRGVGRSDQLRYLVVDDEHSLTGEGVRFLEVSNRAANSETDRVMPPVVREWLNKMIGAYFERDAASADGSLGVSRHRAEMFLNQMAGGHAAGESPNDRSSHRSATRNLIAFLDDPANAHEPLVRLWRRLELPVGALLAFLICLAPELDLRYQFIYWHIHDDVTRRHATASLVDALLRGQSATTHRSALAALLRWRLISPDSSQADGAGQALHPDPVLLQWLVAGDESLWNDAQLSTVLRAQEWPGEQIIDEPGNESDEKFIVGGLTTFDSRSRWHVLSGQDLEGWRALLERGAGVVRTRLLRIRVEALAQLDARARDESLTRVARAARLMDRHVVVDASVAPVNSESLDCIVTALKANKTTYLLTADTRVAAAVLPRGRWRQRLRASPTLEARRSCFAAVLRILKLEDSAESGGVRFSDRLAAAYPLDLQGLTTASALASARFRDDESPQARERSFSDVCRMVAAPDLMQLAHRLEPVYEIEQVILPPDKRSQLKEIVANVQHTRTVLEKWGFGAQLPYGRGVAALFAGPSGTGKTMAAQAIARRLGVDVFAVDLSRIVSKYVGETEKHLDSVFADAERSGSVLLFDEADALFGKRSEVKDAHDRYANLEVAYLLQRMEAFGGLAILTTNHRQNLDSSFVRRLRFIVEFPKPDADARRDIWRLCFPSLDLIDDDVDWRLLARFDLSGGTIRQITLRAAFLAAGDNSSKIAMRHLSAALRGELTKLGMQIAERELAEIDRPRQTRDAA